jgi:hypothetical protein
METTKHKYYPENWKPLERWLPAPLCRTRFSWMWNQQGYECYRYRDSGELLHLDSMGQCWDLTELGPIPADFGQHFERCTGHAYTSDLTTAARQTADADNEDDEDDDDVQSVQPPNGESLSRILQQWSVEQDIDPVKLEPLFSELSVYNTLLLAEQEEQCNTLLKTTRCWLK